jgi:hypothetical protein
LACCSSWPEVRAVALRQWFSERCSRCLGYVYTTTSNQTEFQPSEYEIKETEPGARDFPDFDQQALLSEDRARCLNTKPQGQNLHWPFFAMVTMLKCRKQSGSKHGYSFRSISILPAREMVHIMYLKYSLTPSAIHTCLIPKAKYSDHIRTKCASTHRYHPDESNKYCRTTMVSIG